MLSGALDQTLHRALALAVERRHEHAMLRGKKLENPWKKDDNLPR